MIENWRDAEGFNGEYSISSLGRVRSNKRTIKTAKGNRRIPDRIMKTSISEYGYEWVGLGRKGEQKCFFVHRLVLENFIRLSVNDEQGNHKDGNKLNNKLYNLEWVTPSENTKHAYDTGLAKSKKGEENPMSKLSDRERWEICNSKESYSVLATKYNVSRGTIKYTKRTFMNTDKYKEYSE